MSESQDRKPWTDAMKRQCRDGDVYLEDDESDLELGEKACIWLAIAVGVAAFVGLVGWMLPPLVRVVRGWLS